MSYNTKQLRTLRRLSSNFKNHFFLYLYVWNIYPCIYRHHKLIAVGISDRACNPNIFLVDTPSTHDQKCYLNFATCRYIKRDLFDENIPVTQSVIFHLSFFLQNIFLQCIQLYIFKLTPFALIIDSFQSKSKRSVKNILLIIFIFKENIFLYINSKLSFNSATVK